MQYRTDLAIEKQSNGIKTEKSRDFTTYFLENEKGKYYTIEFKSIEKIADFREIEKGIISALENLFPKKSEKILVVGLGNAEITSDAIGPKTASKILATRHIAGAFAESIGLKNLKSVSVVSPNVLGKTGIEVSETVKGVVDTVKPDAVLVIDALCSKSVERIFSCVQLCDSGISPGSGVKNSRRELSKKTLGVPTVAVGVPTVVDAQTIAFELTGKVAKNPYELIVTPKDADLLISRMAELLSETLNVFLQPQIERDVILQLV